MPEQSPIQALVAALESEVWQLVNGPLDPAVTTRDRAVVIDALLKREGFTIVKESQWHR